VKSSIHSVNFLIRGAIFRLKGLGMVSQNISHLGELIDMYHAHEASKRHDKLYALLGMSSDNLSLANLSPDYRVPWDELLQRIVKYLLGKEISAKPLADRELVLIKSKNRVLGKVPSVHSDTAQGGRQGLEVDLRNTIYKPSSYSSHWTAQASAKSIKKGDIIHLLEGASKPMVIRLHNGHGTIVLIVVTPPNPVLENLEP
jgi:hypothetical protein